MVPVGILLDLHSWARHVPDRPDLLRQRLPETLGVDVRLLRGSSRHVGIGRVNGILRICVPDQQTGHAHYEHQVFRSAGTAHVRSVRGTLFHDQNDVLQHAGAVQPGLVRCGE